MFILAHIHFKLEKTLGFIQPCRSVVMTMQIKMLHPILGHDKATQKSSRGQ